MAEAQIETQSEAYREGWGFALRYRCSLDDVIAYSETGHLHHLSPEEWANWMQGASDAIKMRQDFNKDDPNDRPCPICHQYDHNHTSECPIRKALAPGVGTEA